MPQTNIATEISRIQTATNDIRTKFVELGISSSIDKLDALAQSAKGITNQGAVQATVIEGATYTIPAGYHNGTGTVAGVGGGGNYTLQAKTVTPTKSQQSITSDSGYYGLSGVTVKAIPDNYQDVSATTAAEGNVLSGKIFTTADGTVTTGTMPDNGAVNQTLSTTKTSYTVPAGYHNGSGKVQVSLETKTVTPISTSVTITPTSGKLFSSVTVNPIPNNYMDVFDATVTAEDILENQVAYGLDDEKGDGRGKRIVGTMPNNGVVRLTIDGLTVTSVKIPYGHVADNSTVSLTSDIYDALAAI